MQALCEGSGGLESTESNLEVSHEVRGQLFSKEGTSTHLQTMVGRVESLSLRQVQVKLHAMGESTSDGNKQLLGDER